MSYAKGRIYLDADSHIMERPDFIRDFADSTLRTRLAPLNGGGGGQGKTSEGWLEIVAQPAHLPQRVEAMVALGDNLIAGPKGYQALGAFNPTERSQALNQLGFARQIIFLTFSTGQALHGSDVELMYSATEATNQALADFCGQDPRLMGVGVLPLEDPELSTREAEHRIDLGLNAAMVPHCACGGRSPGHDDLDPVWARLAEAEIPFALHVGG